MCGILGLIDPARSQGTDAAFQMLCDTMQHRGPDGDGYFAQGNLLMGMRRLSIIDLSEGWQPFFSPDRSVVAFQNGMIYNHAQLRGELEKAGYSFKTHCDTEVLAHGYHCWGIDGLLDKLDGMYAIAIFDRRCHHLFLARDRFGEKPLYFANAGGRFAFASAMNVLAAWDWVDQNIDGRALDHYLGVHFIPGERTIYEGIRRVMPGTYLAMDVRDPKPVMRQYYQLPTETNRELNDKQLADILESAVTSRLVSDVPVGIFLSGGLDSAVVAGIAAGASPRIDTFSMGFAERQYDESAHAAAVAKAVGSRHHHFRFDESCFMDLLPQVADALDEPVGDQACLPVYWLAREARQHVTVVLSGEAADEVFAGYDYYRQFTSGGWRRLLPRWLRGQQPRLPMHRFATNPNPQTPAGFPLIADAGGRYNLTYNAYPQADSWEANFIASLQHFGDPLQRASAADMQTWLTDDLLIKFDRMTMAHSLEGRAPFLDPQVVAAGLGLPAAQRMTHRGNSSKIALRRVARRWVPGDLLERKKQGFVLPMKSWLKQWFEHHGGADAYFKTSPFPAIDMARLTTLVQSDLDRGVENERFQFAALMLCEWHRHFDRKRHEHRQAITKLEAAPLIDEPALAENLLVEAALPQPQQKTDEAAPAEEQAMAPHTNQNDTPAATPIEAAQTLIGVGVEKASIDYLQVLRSGIMRVDGWAHDLDLIDQNLSFEINDQPVARKHVFRIYRPDLPTALDVQDPFLGFTVEFLPEEGIVSSGEHRLAVYYKKNCLHRAIHRLAYTQPGYKHLFDDAKVWHRDRIYSQGAPLHQLVTEVEEMVPRLHGKVLDFGCGNGFLVRHLQNCGLDAHGIELETDRIRDNIYPEVFDRIHLFDGSFPMPFEDSAFDCVISTEVIEHVPPFEAALADIARVTKHLFVITVPDCSAIPVGSPHGIVPWHLLESTHYNFFTQTSLTRLLQRHFSRIEHMRIGVHRVNDEIFYGSLAAFCYV